MKLKIYVILASIVFLFTNCNDVLDRPSLTSAEDDTYWSSEARVRLYANAFYSNFFVGYGVAYETTYAPNANYTFNDDAVRRSTQTNFGRSVPTSKGSTSLDIMWQSEFTGPTWNFAWIRKANIMLDRINNLMPNILTEEQFNHWTGIGRFFRALEYARMVNVFGDVPYYDTEVKNTDKDALYRDRTPRNEVMDAVYNDFDFALQNVRLTDGAQNVDRYVVAAFVSRWALFEASWQKYYYKDNERAKKFFEQAIAAAEIVKGSGKYAIDVDFRTLFGSVAKPGKECILYRTYDAGKKVTHSIASTCNPQNSTDVGPNLDLIKAFVCTDGKDYQTSGVTNAKDFTLSNLIKTRDPRFEASFYEKPTATAKSSYLFLTKFIPRSALEFLKIEGGSPSSEFTGSSNVTGYPVIRYAEVLLNWIEAKAELATLGGTAVIQDDIDASINKIRQRPVAPEATKLGVTRTADMDLNDLPNDPRRDPTVSALLWEIRRERRMEFAFEFSRIIDLRRWGKLEYMDTDKNKDLLIGTWVNFVDEAKADLEPDKGNIGKIRVMDKDGNFIVYDGKNGDKLKGFFYPVENQGRLQFLNVPNVNPYLSPIGTNQIADYQTKGYTLTQTEGWPTGLK